MKRYLAVVLALVLCLSSVSVNALQPPKYNQNLLAGPDVVDVANWTDLTYDHIRWEIFFNESNYENWDNLFAGDGTPCLMPKFGGGYYFDGAVPRPFHQLGQQIDLSDYQAGEQIEAYVSLAKSLAGYGIDHTAFLIVRFFDNDGGIDYYYNWGNPIKDYKVTMKETIYDEDDYLQISCPIPAGASHAVMILGVVNSTETGPGYEPLNKVTNIRFSDPSFMVVKPKYQVTFDSDGGTAVDNQMVTEGESAIEPSTIPTKAHHTFKHWGLYENVADWGKNSYDFSRAITRDIILKAVYQEDKKWKILWIANEDSRTGETLTDVSFAGGGSTSVYDGEIATLAADPVRPGYRFLHWETLIQNEGWRVFDPSQPIHKNYKLFPVFESTEKFNVTFDSDGGTPEPAVQQVKKDELATKPADPQKANYTFKYWGLYENVDGWDDAAYDFSRPVTHDIILKAVYRANQAAQKFDVAFDSDGGTPIPPVQQVVSGGQATKPADPQKPGYRFDHWALLRNGAVQRAFDFSVPITENITLKAVYQTANSANLTVSFDAAGGAPIPPNQQVVSGGQATKPADPQKPGYRFDHWALLRNGAVQSAFDFSAPITENITLKAVYKVANSANFTVSFDAAGGAPIPPAQQVVSGGQAVRPPVDPVKQGQVFTGWYNGGQLYDFSQPVQQNIKLVAGYQAQEKIQVIFETAGGLPVPDNQVLDPGARVVKPDVDPVKQDYTFKGWYTALGEYDFATAVERNMILYAKYDKLGSSHDNSRRQDIDIDDDDYDKAIIDYKMPFFKGYPSGIFKPDDTISRAEMATVFVRLLKLEAAPLSGSSVFSDIAGHWAEQNILRAAEYGILNGYPDGSFQPDGKMKRAEIAAIITKYWQLKGFQPNGQDAPIGDINGHWAEKLILSLYNHRFIDLYNDKTFRPDAPLKRAEVAQVFNRITDRPLTVIAQPLFNDVPRSHWSYDEVNTAASNLQVAQ